MPVLMAPLEGIITGILIDWVGTLVGGEGKQLLDYY